VPIELDWKSGRFFDDERLLLLCSLHGSAYAPDPGKCLGESRVKARLVSLPVEERDGRVYLKNNEHAKEAADG
jgi:nitrite reductase/ring-hydroxylating ferredoxin subunit